MAKKHINKKRYVKYKIKYSYLNVDGYLRKSDIVINVNLHLSTLSEEQNIYLIIDNKESHNLAESVFRKIAEEKNINIYSVDDIRAKP